MDPKISTMSPDVVTVTSEPRPTATPIRTSFSEVMARGAGSVVGGAESAMVALPGTSVMALAVRGGAAGATVAPLPMGAGLPVAPLGAPTMGLGASAAEGPGGGASVGLGSQFVSSMNAAAAGDGGAAAASLQQGAQSNLYYLQLQQQINQQSQSFEAMSNVMKTESDTVKNAIGNMH
jgi:hypothetical protein